MRLKGILLSILAVALFGSLGVAWLAPDRLTQAPGTSVTPLQGEQLVVRD